MFEKIKAIYPSLTEADFHPLTGTILLQKDLDKEQPYIAKWEHPTLKQPTQEHL